MGVFYQVELIPTPIVMNEAQYASPLSFRSSRRHLAKRGKHNGKIIASSQWEYLSRKGEFHHRSAY